MAYPTSMYVQPMTRYNPSGITVEVYPSTVRGLRVELQTATANSTVSSNWGSHIFGPSTAGALRYTVPLAPSTRLYYFKARHAAGNGYSAGPFLPVISARPKLTPDIIRPFMMQMTYQGNVEAPSGSDIYASSARTIKVGTQPTAGTITKTLRFPHGELIPETGSTSYAMVDAYVRGTATGSDNIFYGSIVLPRGVTITAFRARIYSDTFASDIATVEFRRVNGDGTSTSLGTVQTDADATWQTKSTSFTETVDDETYVMKVTLHPVGVADHARFAWAEIDYTMPSYDKAY